MNLSPKHLIKILEHNGFIYDRTKGSHKIHYNLVTSKIAVVPYHGGRDLKKGNFFRNFETSRN